MIYNLKNDCLSVAVSSLGAEIQSEYSISVIIPNLIRSMMIYLTNAILPFMALLFKNENYDSFVKVYESYIPYSMHTVSELCGQGIKTEQ